MNLNIITTKIKFIITISILYFSSCSYSKYVPNPRHSASCISNNNLVYFIGGLDKDSNCLNDFFYLDLSDLKVRPSFDELTSIPPGYCWSSSSFAEGGKKIYTFGGKNETLIYSYDFNSQQWSMPKIDGTSPEVRSHFQSVSDNEKNTIYIFGGQKVIGTNVKFFKDINILNTQYLSWYNTMILGAQKIINPPYWTDFTTTMLSSGEIIYIGGRQSTSPSGTTVTFAKMNEIYVFNTKSSSWDIINASGNIPSSRIGHSAVLKSNNEIIIYGGTSSEDLVTPATPDLAILTVTSKPYQWTTPNVQGQQQSRSFHSAAIVGDIIIIAFGRITGTQSVTSTFNMLDITNFQWITYSLDESDKELKDLQQTFLTQNLAAIIGGTIGGIVVLAVLITIGVLLFKSWKSNRNFRGQPLPSSQNS